MKFRLSLVLIIIAICFFSIEKFNADVCSGPLCGAIESGIGHGGVHTAGNRMLLRGGYDQLHSLRVYLILDVGGSKPQLLSNVKDINSTVTQASMSFPHDHPMFYNVTRHSVNREGRGLGYRWDNNLVHSSTAYNNLFLNQPHFYGVTTPMLGANEHGIPAAQIVPQFFNRLAERTGADDPACANHHNCLITFLLEDLGVFDPTWRANLENLENLEHVYIMVEPAMRYMWYCETANKSNCPSTGGQHTYVLTATEGFQLSNANIYHQHINRSYFQGVFSTVYNRAAHIIMNNNPSGIANSPQPGRLSYLDQVRPASSRNIPWKHPGTLGFTWRTYSWSLYSPNHAQQTYQNTAIHTPSQQPVSCNPVSHDYCLPGVAGYEGAMVLNHQQVVNYNQYQPGDMVGRSGFGIGYFWLAMLIDEEPPVGNVCEMAIESVHDPFSNPETNATWRVFRENYLGNSATIFNCCDRDNADIVAEDETFLEYVQRMENMPGLPVLQTYAAALRSVYNSDCLEEDEEDECEYYVDVSCVDCELPVDSGLIRDIDDWDCIFQSDTLPAEAPFDNHYIEFTNAYCKIYCREEVSYQYPNPWLQVQAGRHFILGPEFELDMPGARPVVSWGELRYDSFAECRPTMARMDGETYDGDHDDMFIDHTKFVYDFEEANEEVGHAWDIAQQAYLLYQGRTDAYFDGPSASCGRVFQGPNTNNDGCLKEYAWYSCPSPFVPADGGSDLRRTNDYICHQTQSINYRHYCPTGYSSSLSGTCQSSSFTCTRTESFWVPSQPAEYDSDGNLISPFIPGYWSSVTYSTSSIPDTSQRCCTASGYQPAMVHGSWQCEMTTNPTGPHWVCEEYTSSSDSYHSLQMIRTPDYSYNDPNYNENSIPSAKHPRQVCSGSICYEQWCSDRTIHTNQADLWVPQTGANGFMETSVNNPGSLVWRDEDYNSAEARGLFNDARIAYERAVRDRDALVDAIYDCNRFEYLLSGLEPDYYLTYDDIKYGNSFDLIREGESGPQPTRLYQQGSEGPFVEDQIDKFDCPSSYGYHSGVNCLIVPQNYPINDDFYYRTDGTLSFSLGDYHRYVSKPNDGRTVLSRDAVSDDVRWPGDINYVDMGYGNLPVHFYQGEFPGYGNFAEGQIGLFLRSTLGQFYRFNDFVFGPYVDPNLEADCFDYECIYYVGYDFPPPQDDIAMLVKFRPIDFENPFPGFAGTGRTPGINWDSDSINRFITNNRNVSGDAVYDLPPMYTISLNPTQIRTIREYNRNRDYLSADLNCLDGIGGSKHLKCVSSFIDQFDFITRGPCTGVTSQTWDNCHN